MEIPHTAFREVRFRHAIPVLLLACLLPVLSDAASPTEDFSRGKDLLLKGNTIEAEAAFRRALDGDPSNLDRRLALADAQARRIGLYPEAEKNYRAVLGDPRTAAGKGLGLARVRASTGLGSLMVKTGRSREAIPLLKEALATTSGLPQDDIRAVLALAYYEERLYDDAILELRQATRANPRHGTALFNLKTLRTRLEPYQSGKIYARVGNHEGAISQFRKSIQYDPRFIGARLHLGMELLQTGKAVEALRELHRAESISPTYPKMWEIWYAQGQTLGTLKRNPEALAKYQSIVDLQPKFAPAQYEMGVILESENKLPEAAARYALAIEGDPRTDYVRRLQAILNRLGSAPTTLPAVAPVNNRTQ